MARRSVALAGIRRTSALFRAGPCRVHRFSEISPSRRISPARLDGRRLPLDRIPPGHMRTVRKTIKWIFVLLLIGGTSAGGYSFYLWNHSDEFLRRTLLDRLHEVAPDWNLSLSRARFDILGR